MRRAGINQDRVAGPWIYFATIALDNFDLCQVAQIRARPPGELRIDFNGRHAALVADNFSHDRCVVAWATADVDHVLSWL